MSEISFQFLCLIAADFCSTSQPLPAHSLWIINWVALESDPEISVRVKVSYLGSSGDTISAMGKWHRERKAANKSQVIKPVTILGNWVWILQGKPQKRCKTHISDILTQQLRALKCFYTNSQGMLWEGGRVSNTSSPQYIAWHLLEQPSELPENKTGYQTWKCTHRQLDVCCRKWNGWWTEQNKHDIEGHIHFSEFVFFPGFWTLKFWLP